jgi:hypothetical protein
MGRRGRLIGGDGTPLATAQKLARHSDPRLAANVYTHLGLADLARAVENLPAIGATTSPPAADPKHAGEDSGPETTATEG